MSDLQLETGKPYKIRHSRKGTFFGRLISIRGEWADVEVTRGAAGAMLSYNEASVGEVVTVRLSFCTFAPVESGSEGAA